MAGVFRRILLTFICFAILVIPNFLLAEGNSEHVTFKKGALSGVLKGTVAGYEHKDYLIRAAAGRTMHVKLKAGNKFLVFSIYLKDGKAEPGELVIPETGPEWSGKLPKDGDYVIRVYLIRAEAGRTGANAAYTLEIAVR